MIYCKFASMKKKKSVAPKPPIDLLKRDKKVTVTFNEKEMNMMRSYLESNKISNQTRWIREVVMHYLWQKAEENYPTLFNENEIRK